MRKLSHFAAHVAVTVTILLIAAPAQAGPPFMTDDPEPTEQGHWEIYGPLIDVEGRGGDFSGSAGAEINYGALPHVQLTLGLPAAFSHTSSDTSWGAGDVELAVKYQFYQNEDAGLSIAAFPGITLPTASNGMGNGKVTALLPVWAQKDIGPWSIFGGGGYAFNPGVGNRDYWTGGVAVTREMSPDLLIGIEAKRQGPDTLDGRANTPAGLGVIYNMTPTLRLLASGGPTFEDGGGKAGFHAFFALGMDM